MSLYSVVVPVYNSEHTLEELYHRLERVFRETLKEDFELILVDDGSKDRSYEIMEKLRSRDHRVKISTDLLFHFSSVSSRRIT
jgi:polyisoprenyl-phosphate glycosyltransferase